MSQVTDQHVSFYQENGYVLIDNFLTPEEVTRLKNDIRNVLNKSKVPDTVRSHVQMMGTKFMLDSVASAGLFFEKDCVTPDGKLTQPLDKAVHKIAHGTHLVCDNAKAITFSDKMQAAVRKLTGFRDPALMQGMFILKQPGYGEPSPMHADESYVMSDPQGYVAGIWIALDDSLQHNGCLQFIPGSHRTHKVTKKWIRSRIEGHEAGHEDESIMKFVDKDPDSTASVREEDFVPVEVRSGGLVLIHGLVLHRSSPNTSPDPRAAYTFHFYEKGKDGVHWSPLNWAQETDDCKFLSLYS
jgi:hypothetical protein